MPAETVAELLAVFAAYHLDGLNERQTAERLGITRHQVRTRRAQAAALLRPHIQTLVADGAGI